MGIKKILSIAGSDSSGGAGIQADLKTITSYKFYGMTAITAITAQNTMGVQASSPISEEMLKGQLLSICQDIMPHAVKIGMVASPGQVEVISEIAEKYFKDLPIVLDPVITSTSGFTLVPDDTLEKMKEILFQKATLITPNLIEAGIIYGKKIESLEEMKEAAEFLYNKYKVAFLIKGGHLKDSKDDVLCGREGLFTDTLPGMFLHSHKAPLGEKCFFRFPTDFAVFQTITAYTYSIFFSHHKLSPSP